MAPTVTVYSGGSERVRWEGLGVAFVATALWLPALLLLGDFLGPTWFQLFALAGAALTLGGAFGIVSLRKSTVDVGTDGVLLARRGRARSFVRHADVLDVHVRDEHDVAVVLRSGNEILLGLEAPGRNIGRKTHRAASRDAAEALANRIRGALEAFRANQVDETVAARLARSGRSKEEWLAALGSAVEENASFRSIGITEEKLLDVVENPAVDASARAGAAVALRCQGSHVAREHVRIVAARTASPALRHVLFRVADGADAEVEDALDEFDGAKARRLPS